jgi:hypothetical protein
MRVRRLLLVVLIAVLVGAVGCGKPTGTVSGKVTFKGQPVSFGTIALLSEDGQVVSAMLEPDGGYTVGKVPVGPARITVQSMPPPPPIRPLDDKMGEKMPAMGERKFVPIPKRYLDAEKGGLTYTVKEGPQTPDLDLQP